MELKNNEPSGLPTHFLSAAIRSWMVNQLLDPQDVDEVFFLLLELELEIDKNFHSDPKLFLKKEMSRIAAQKSQASQELLIRLCEGIVQFYLIRNQKNQTDLNHLNTLLPLGYTFNIQNGILTFTGKLEHTHLERIKSQNTVNLYKNETHGSASTEADNSRREQFKQIRQRRLALLKEWEKPDDQH